MRARFPVRALLLAALALMFVLVALAPIVRTTSAEAAAMTRSICPDGFFLVPAATSPKQDKNGDGLICEKVEDGKSVGGPDDKFQDDIII